MDLNLCDASEPEFDDLVQLASVVCGVPIALITLFESGRRWFTGPSGWEPGQIAPEASSRVREGGDRGALVVPDTHGSVSLASLIVNDPSIRFYASASLVGAEGALLGELYVLDFAPGMLCAEQTAALAALGRLAARLCEAGGRSAKDAGESRVREGENEALERRVAERTRALAGANDRLSSIIAASPAAIFTYDRTGLLTSWSRGAEAMFGWSAEEVLGGMLPFVPEESLSEMRALMDRLVRGEAIAGAEVSRRRKDGAPIEISISAAPLFNSSGEVDGAMSVVLDITERKRSEQTLEKEREFLKAMLDNIHDGLVACDGAGAPTMFNDAIRRLHGLPESWIPPDHWALRCDLFHPDGLTQMTMEELPILRALNGERVRDVEVVIVPATGDPKLLLVSGQAIHSPSGEKLGAVVALQDITERRRAEEALEKSRVRLLEAQRQARMGNWEMERATGRVTWSEEMFRIFGRDPALGMPTPDEVRAMHHPDESDDISASVDRAMETGISLHADRRILLPDGTMKWVHTTAHTVQDEQGAIVSLVGTTADVTERKHAEQQIRDYAALLEIQMKALEEANAKLEELATRDGLTDLTNRRAFDARLKEEFDRAARTRGSLSLILLDIDRFKQFNDDFGHPSGDEALRSTAALLRGVVRETDVLARYGGEEIVIIAVDTDERGAMDLAERVRHAIEHARWPKRRITASIGVSSVNAATPSPGALVERADRAMYQSKRDGRNRITLAES